MRQNYSTIDKTMNISGDNIDDILASAKQNGMYLVDESNTSTLEKEFDDCIIEVDRLCEIIDPEQTPFDSKYQARKILDNVCNKLEATKTIASLEKKRDVIALMNRKIGMASFRFASRYVALYYRILRAENHQR